MSMELLHGKRALVMGVANERSIACIVASSSTSMAVRRGNQASPE